VLLRQGLPITQGTVHLFLTGGNFLVNEIMMSYFMNSIEFIKIGTTDTRLVFFFFHGLKGKLLNVKAFRSPF
jgi:hypothetical protein